MEREGLVGTLQLTVILFLLLSRPLFPLFLLFPPIHIESDPDEGDILNVVYNRQVEFVD